MPRIAIAFDGSPSSHAAIERSGALFPGAEAVVICAAARLGDLADSASAARAALPGDVIRSAVARLREAALADARELAATGVAAATAAGLQAREEVVAAEGSLSAELIDAARRVEADAVACGTHGYGAAARAILGSVSSGLVRDAPVPVLVVPQGTATDAGPLVVGFDDSEPSAHAVAAAGRLLAGREAVVLNVWRSQIRHTLSGQALHHAPLRELREIVEDLDEVFEESSRAEAERGAELAREHGLDARPRVIESSASVAAVVLETARAEAAAAIVLGRRGRGAVARAILGSVSASVLHAADRPVLVA